MNSWTAPPLLNCIEMTFKIAVRSYGRSDTILKKTLGVLAAQKDLDLEKQLVIAVTNEEFTLYHDVLKDFPKLALIPCEKGGHNATNALIEYIDEGEQVIFMDDDISKVQCYRDIADPKSRYDVDNLGEFFEYAFRIFKDIPFGFDFTPNLMFKQGKPFAEFKMRKIGGAWWGGVNRKAMFKVNQSHEDDNIRTAKCLNRHGGVGSINWLTAVTAVGTNKGGMQSSGDRGNDNRAAATYDACGTALQQPYVKEFYQFEPFFIESMDFYSLRLKNIRELRKMYPLNIALNWSSFMQERPDSNPNLEEFF